MTRFMMTVENAVGLVLYAFEHGSPGDLFVQKAPAATLETLVAAMQSVYGREAPVRVIGSRHGEKLYETLLTREEMARTEDLGDYYRVVPDGRDLNYDLYFTEGAPEASTVEDYHSHNTRRLDVAEMAEMLLQVGSVRRDLDLPPLAGEPD
jgi:UDP-glucose 4-epimerase